MNARALECVKKLSYAKRHLDSMRKAYPGDRDTLDYELSAFLLESRSVVDCMNEDINLQYGLNLSLEMDLIKQLDDLKSKDGRIESYQKWHMPRHAELMENDPMYRYFFNHDTGLRNITDHRKAVGPSLAHVTITEALTVTDSIKIEVHHLDTGITETLEDVKTPKIEPEEKPTEPKSQLDWFFGDEDGNPISDGT